MTKPKSWWHAWLDGAATVLDLGGTSVKMPRRMTDAEAIASDWAQVGQDLWSAIKTVQTERKPQKASE